MKYSLLLVILFSVSCATVKKTEVSPSDVYKTNSFIGLKSKAYEIKGICPKYQEKKHNDLTLKRLKEYSNICIKQSKLDRATSYSRVILSNYKKSPWGYYYLSVVAEYEKNYPLAIWMIENAQDKQPSSGLFHYQRARIKLKNNDLHGAMADMQRSIEKDPNLEAAHLYLARSYINSLQFKQSLKHYNLIYKNNAVHKEALAGIADNYYFLGKFKDAILFFDKAIKVDHRNLDIRLRRASIYEKKMNNSSVALSLYKKIRILMKSNKHNKKTSFNLNQKIRELETVVSKLNNKKRSVSSLKNKGVN